MATRPGSARKGVAGGRSGAQATGGGLSRRGIQTSEFWLVGAFVFAVLAAATVLAALDKLSAGDWTKIVTGGGSVPVVGYALSRGITKFGLGSSDGTSGPGGSGL
jgi:hypothetical protein